MPNLGATVGRVGVLEFACTCGRSDRYRPAELVERFGADATFRTVLLGLSEGCPQRAPGVPLWHCCRYCCPTLSRLALGGA